MFETKITIPRSRWDNDSFAHMVKALQFSACLCLFFFSSFAQESSTVLSNDTTSEQHAQWVISPELEGYFDVMDSVDLKGIKSQGFRIQLFSATGANARASALKSQSEFLQLNPNVAAYTKWNNPSWVVRIGDFRTRLEALEVHATLREQFPASFIVADEISVDY